MTAKLKPCPFCGGEAELGTKKLVGLLMSAIVCPKCKASTNIFDEFTDVDTAEKAAVDAWNRRTEVKQ